MATTVWRGHLSFGLVSIPVRLFRAARAERVSLKRLYRVPASKSGSATRPASEYAPADEVEQEEEPAREEISDRASHPPMRPVTPELAAVQQVSVPPGSDNILSPQAVVKGYEYAKDRYIEIEPEVLKSIAPKTATEMQIEEFVKLAEVDPVYFETSYYVVPEDAGMKAYSLLYRSLQATQLVALSKFAMHNREHVVIVRPGRKGLLAHTMYFQSEVRADQEYAADVEGISAREAKLAETLIRALAAPFEPEKYRDTYREELEAIIARKIEGQPVTPARRHPAPVADIAEALQRSLATLKKPILSEKGAAQNTRSSKASGKKVRRAS